MRILKSIFALLIVASIFTACGEEEYIQPDLQIEDASMGDRSEDPSGPPLPPGDND